MIDTRISASLAKFAEIVLLFHHRFELRVRFIPESLEDLLARDRVSFTYFYEEVSLRYFFCLPLHCIMDFFLGQS